MANDIYIYACAKPAEQGYMYVCQSNKLESDLYAPNQCGCYICIHRGKQNWARV